MMADTHNVIGVTEETSGNEFLATGREQVQYGGTFERGFVTDVDRTDDDRFRLSTTGAEILSDRVVLATGFSDKRPDPPLPRTGKGLHYCLHCDAYMFVDEPVYVMGHGEAAAHVAMIMLNVTDDVDILTRGAEPTWSDETAAQLDAPGRGRRRGRDGRGERPRLRLAGGAGVRRRHPPRVPRRLRDVRLRLQHRARRGARLRSDRGRRRIDVDDHGRTSENGVFAVGDITPGHNQVPVAMGRGAKAGLAIHKDIREFPRSQETIEADGPVDADEVPAISPALMATAVAHEGHAGGARVKGVEAKEETPAADDD